MIINQRPQKAISGHIPSMIKISIIVFVHLGHWAHRSKLDSRKEKEIGKSWLSTRQLILNPSKN